jgi:hypothetical protein
VIRQWHSDEEVHDESPILEADVLSCLDDILPDSDNDTITSAGFPNNNCCGATFNMPNLCRFADFSFRFTDMRAIPVPDSVESIGPSALRGCFSLVALSFGSNSRLKEICARAFPRSCISDLAFRSSVEMLANHALQMCVNPRFVTFSRPSSLIRIGECAFAETDISGFH